MSEYHFLVYSPKSPKSKIYVVGLDGSSYVVQALDYCAAKYGLKDPQNMRLIAVSPHRR